MNRKREVVVAVVAGLFLGTAASACDALGSGLPPSDAWRALGVVPNLATTWLVLAFVIGRRAGRLAAAAVEGALALLVGIIGYYSFGVAFGDRAALGVAAVLPTALRWSALALVAGPIGGLLGAATRRPPSIAVPSAAMVPLAITAETLGWHHWTPANLTVDPYSGWPVLAALVTLTALGVIVAARSILTAVRTG